MWQKLWDYFKENRYIITISATLITTLTYFYKYKSIIALKSIYGYKLFISFDKNDTFITTSGLPLPYAFAQRIDYLFPPDDFYFLSFYIIDVIFWTLLLTLLFYYIKKL